MSREIKIKHEGIAADARAAGGGWCCMCFVDQVKVWTSLCRPATGKVNWGGKVGGKGRVCVSPGGQTPAEVLCLCITESVAGQWPPAGSGSHRSLTVASDRYGSR